MFKPKKPNEIIGFFAVGCVTIILGYYLSKGLMNQDDFFYGFGFLAIFGAIFILSAIKMNSEYNNKIAMIDSLLISGDTLQAVIINSRALAGKKRGPPKGYEYMCQGFEGEKIYGSDMIQEDRYTLGQRVTIYVDRGDADRYWVDLDSVVEKNEKSEKVLKAYQEYKGEGILNVILHAYDDRQDGKPRMLFMIAVVGIIFAGIPFIMMMQFLFFMWNPEAINIPYWRFGLSVVFLIPYAYLFYKFYNKISLAFGKSFFEGLQKVLTEIQKNAKN